MAGGNYRHYLQSDNVKIKKYFYVLRPILACLWIENFRESPPIEFENTAQTFDSGKKPKSELLDEGFIKILDYLDANAH